jgi:hypothetical protein
VKIGRFVILLLTLAFICCGCSSHAYTSIPDRALLGVYPGSNTSLAVTSETKNVEALVETIVPKQDVIRGFWGIYSFPPDKGYRVPSEIYKGYRVNIRISSITWVETYPPITSRFWVVGRGLVRGEPGTIVLRLKDAQSPRLPTDVPVEGFVPDAFDVNGLFRERHNGTWSEWKKGDVMHEFR